jgi:3-hydroxyisobutyrate dehydrogenase-like beta-hydroxyacid dehydrogenase
VGFIGIGNMGLAMALRLRDAGQAVRAHDIDNQRCDQAALAGVQIVGTPAEVAAGLSLLMVVVVDAAQCEAVLFGPQGAASALPAGATVMLCPTIAPHDVEQLAQRLAAQGLQCIDAPMSGGPMRARDGSMSLMVACSDALWAAHEALLAHLAGRLVRVGTRLGDGARTKLVNNLLAAINLAGAAEAMALAQHLGLDAQRTLAVIGQSSGQSWIGIDRMARALQGDFTPLAHTTLLAKDSGLAMAMAAQSGLKPPMGAQAAALFQDALAAGYGPEDDGRLLSLLQQRLQAR